MNALTILQPYAHLITLPDASPLKKRVENREWHAPAAAIGKPLVIHAGKSRAWLTGKDEQNYPGMIFGAAVAVARLAASVGVRDCERGKFDREFPWLREHIHAAGPCCWVLTEVRKLPEPIQYRGAQGLWKFPDELLPEGFRA
ncbi:MAG: hypothetical protein KIS92_20050 [Planctomycetota bacterium]|nr:hypothetical protein [Planctomycetota bacterium]